MGTMTDAAMILTHLDSVIGFIQVIFSTSTARNLGLHLQQMLWRLHRRVLLIKCLSLKRFRRFLISLILQFLEKAFEFRWLVML